MSPFQNKRNLRINKCVKLNHLTNFGKVVQIQRICPERKRELITPVLQLCLQLEFKALA